MQHPDEGTIHSWLDGALPTRESAELEAHVQGCAQCAAAVAEARGFIAGASRILTALDSVPSGVVPVAKRSKSRDWPVWRAAAAIVIVALGSFVVLKDRVGRTDQRVSDLSSGSIASTQTTAAQTAVPQAAAAPTLNAAVPSQRETPRVGAKQMVVPEATGGVRAATPRAEPAGAANKPMVSGVQIAGANARENASSPPVAGIVSAGQPTQFSRGNSAVAMDAATTSSLPRDVGRRRGVGASTTLYELSPGDTVVLTQATELRLESVAATGAATQRSVVTNGAGVMAKSAAPDTQHRAVAAQRDAQSTAQSATPPTAPPRGAAGVANASNTISWVDSATGARMTLSGRHSVRELEEIRQKIERLRAAEAAEKKRP